MAELASDKDGGQTQQRLPARRGMGDMQPWACLVGLPTGVRAGLAARRVPEESIAKLLGGNIACRLAGPGNKD